MHTLNIEKDITAPCKDESIEIELIHRQSALIAMSNKNPLSTSACLTASDIVDQPIVGHPKHARPILH